jgi:Tfp pilus assembly protein PilX
MIGDMIVTEKNNKQKGAASLLIVIFTALIVVIITVGFIRQMLSDQQQATVNDLSQSAFDSAQAGVEDAKRAVIRYQNICNTGTYVECQQAYDNVVKNECNYANGQLSDVFAVKNPTTKEVKVQTGTSNNLDQAYTCVKILLDTADYVGQLKQDESKMIPLIGASGFDTVRVEWFNSLDLQGSGALVVNVPAATNPAPLLAQNSWTSTSSLNRPAIMRTQLMQFAASGFTLSDFDNNTANASNSTMFLYPSSINGVPATGFSSLARRTATVKPTNTLCTASIGGGGYSCKADIKLSFAVGAGDRTAYLNLKSLYKKSHYRVTLLSGTNPVLFHAVQPSVDSTGRANDFYRRVSSRIELGDVSFPYPEAAVDLTGNFCKNFIVTDKPSEYENYCSP